MAKDKKPIQQYNEIGGWLWFPALWTVTNFLVAGYLAIHAPIVGAILLVLAIPNAYFFWTRKKIYRWFFVLHSIAGLFVLLVAFGPQGVGGGFAWNLIFMVYLLVSKRARGTFTQPLFGRTEPAAITE
ncbi:hypothetical protein KVQ82_16435 [Pseudomonas sp. AO-1]|uniref:hypothetical protein n=1 Tax=Pseudomonas sp. AO-1 TaxID=2855434 RepID=UPI001C78FB96|nr:hypothetical protein [Pseudomonas sp. AO-1]QXZ11681.1 hypothetical protein KVQ82_16435 [Pseudomonas sp. AO-1]